MGVRMNKLIEQPTGTALVSFADGSPVREMGYSLSVTRHFHDGGVPGSFDVDGQVAVTPDEGEAFMRDGTPLTLTLEDGRFIDFALVDATGRIRNRSSRFLQTVPQK